MQLTVKHPHGAYQINKSQSSLSFGIKQVQHSVQLRAETYEKIDSAGQEEAQGHNPLLTEAVNQKSVHKSGKTVDDTMKGQEYTQLSL